MVLMICFMFWMFFLRLFLFFVVVLYFLYFFLLIIFIRSFVFIFLRLSWRRICNVRIFVVFIFCCIWRLDLSFMMLLLSVVLVGCRRLLSWCVFFVNVGLLVLRFCLRCWWLFIVIKSILMILSFLRVILLRNLMFGILCF